MFRIECDFRRCSLLAAVITPIFAALPSYIQPCKKSDPKIDQCITNTIEGLRDKLKVGIPELDVPAIEPLTLKQIRLLRGPQGARLDINLTDIQVSGPSSFEVRELKANTENVTFAFKVSFNKLSFHGKYQIDARILLLRLAGSGDLTGNFSGYDSDVILRAQKIVRDNDTYLKFDKMEIGIKVGKANIYLSNLFGGDPILGPASNQLLNANSNLFLDEVRPVLEDALANLFTDVANKVTRSFTYRELFPDD
ncbi:hypothetical protein PV327_000426 [Microctonus hyperodae]|uniref:Uncharacterized protein n=1 Tax=Microctonus hyperodae TaxID=165561 RepID=A0AA39G686_MICHY|nr:hypothetical protein PV327_000426 [Microctonus hyperodae]